MIVLSETQLHSILAAALAVPASRREEFADAVCLELVALEQTEKGNRSDEDQD
jgi:hypothetical protein